MTDLQRALLAKAGRALTTARRNLDHGDAEAATNRAYYACFYVAQAAVLGVGEEPKTHSGTHARFRFHFVSGGPVSVEVGSILADAFAARQRLDYNALAVTDARSVADLLADAERFVESVRRLVVAS